MRLKSGDTEEEVEGDAVVEGVDGGAEEEGELDGGAENEEEGIAREVDEEDEEDGSGGREGAGI